MDHLDASYPASPLIDNAQHHHRWIDVNITTTATTNRTRAQRGSQHDDSRNLGSARRRGGRRGSAGRERCCD